MGVNLSKASIDTEVKHTRDISYWPESNHPRHFLDIYVPISSRNSWIRASGVSSELGVVERNSTIRTDEECKPQAMFPVMVFVHGGGWHRGSKTSCRCGTSVFSSVCATSYESV